MTGSHDDVPSDVFDAPFAFEGGAMVMETDLDLNGHALLNLPLRPSKHFIFAKYEKGKHSDCLIFSNEDEDETNYWQQFGSDFRILNVTLFIIQRGPNPVSGSTIIMTSVVRGDRVTRKAVNHSPIHLVHCSSPSIKMLGRKKLSIWFSRMEMPFKEQKRQF